MLPMLMLQPTELATFTPEPNSADLLPQDATEPVMAFADILQVGLQPLVETAQDNGRSLPLSGNGLPPGAGAETGTPGLAREGVLPLPAVESVSIDARPGVGLLG